MNFPLSVLGEAYCVVSLAYPDQGDRIKAVENTVDKKEINKLKEGLRAKAVKLLNGVFDKGLDVIAGPTDSALLIHGAAAGT